MLELKYTKAYKEVITILKCLSEEEKQKIPISEWQFYEENSDDEYEFKIVPGISLDKQEISQEAKAILVTIFLDFFATENQKIKLKEILIENDMRKRQDIIINQDMLNITNKANVESKNKSEKQLIIYNKKDTLFERIINKLRSIFKFIK